MDLAARLATSCGALDTCVAGGGRPEPGPLAAHPGVARPAWEAARRRLPAPHPSGHSSSPAMPPCQLPRRDLPHSATSSSPAHWRRRSLPGHVPPGLPSLARQRRHAAPDLFLADDRRAWAPATALLPLWQRLRLAMLASLHAAHRAGHAHPTAEQTARAVAARIMAQLRADMQRDWILVGGGLRRAGGMCSAWYRGRDVRMTREEYQEAMVPPRRAPLPHRGRGRAADPLDRCRAGAAASMIIQAVSTLSTSHTGHPRLNKGGSAPCLMGVLLHPIPQGELCLCH